MNFRTIGFFVIGFGDRLHHPRRSGHVDLPHAVEVKHPRPHRVQDERQMDDRLGPGVPQQKEKLPAGFFFTQIHALELQRKIGHGRRSHPAQSR